MSGTGPLLLIVDDSRTSRTIIRGIVAQLRPHWRIAEAASGDEALALTEALAPDFVSMDANMPGISGLEAAARLRERHPAVRIVLFTANIQEVVRDAVHKAGFHFVAKPVTPQSVGLALDHFEGC